jgi:hypothetical protein
MKLRTGFVSNSSSQSFVIRGGVFKISEAMGNLGITDVDNELDDGWSAIYGKLSRLKSPLKVESNRDFFDGEDTGEVIIGMELCKLSDGVVEEVPDDLYEIDNTIRSEMAKVGLLVPMKLKTYIQYISNDNY